jgi:DNA-binding GntR family transcriptional regulator
MPRASKKSPAPAVTGTAVTETAEGQGGSVESIAQDIAAAIVEKRLPPGTWLREEALGRVYAVSRTKVRAALLMLSKDKLIEIIPDKGAFVSQPSVEEAREVFAVRRLVESEVVRLFVARARPRDYQRLEQHIRFERAALRQSTTTGTVVREKLLGDFHVALAEAAGNSTLAEILGELVARSALIAMLYHSSNDAHCACDEHADFLRLCRRGEVEAAVLSMSDHLRRIEASLALDDAKRPDRQRDLVRALLA